MVSVLPVHLTFVAAIIGPGKVSPARVTLYRIVELDIVILDHDHRGLTGGETHQAIYCR
jgi:hypothetical protein